MIVDKHSSKEEPNLTCLKLWFYFFAIGFTILVLLAFILPALDSIKLS